MMRSPLRISLSSRAIVRARAGSSSSSQTWVTRAKAITTPWSLSWPSGPSVSIPAAASM